MSVYSKVLDAICKVFRWICMVLLFGFIVIVLVSIVFRYILNNSLTWSEQVCRYMFVWMIMLGAPITYRMGRDVCFDLITQSIPDWAQRICKMVSDVGVAFMGAFMGWQGLQYSLAYGDKILAGIEIPQWMMYVSQPVCGFTLVIVCLESFLLGIQWFANRKKVPAGKEVAE